MILASIAIVIIVMIEADVINAVGTEATFEVDASGVLQVSAEHKGTVKKEQVIITAENGSLSEDEIKCMVKEDEFHTETDKKVKERVDAKNRLESCLCALKNQLEDKEKGIEGRASAGGKKESQDLIDETTISLCACFFLKSRIHDRATRQACASRTSFFGEDCLIVRRTLTPWRFVMGLAIPVAEN